MRHESREAALNDDAVAADAADPRRAQPLKLPVLDEEGRGLEKRERPFTSKPVFWIFLAVLLVGAVAGFLFWQNARKWESTDDAFVDAHIVRIAPQVPGILQQVPAQDNQHVNPGDLLAVIEPSGPEASLRNAQGQLAQAEGQLAQAEAQREQARAGVTAAQATRAREAANVGVPAAAEEQAQRDLERYLNLQREQPSAVAATTIDQARAALRQAQAQRRAATAGTVNAGANIAVAARQLAAAEASVRAAQANVRAAQARVASAQVTIGQLRLTAPVAGTIANRSVNIGSYVSPGAQLMAIVPDRIWVTANFKETQLANLRVGQPVEIKVDALPDVTFQGHVESFQRGAGQAFQLLPPQNATGNFVKVVQRVPVRIAFDKPNPLNYPIGPGMSVVPRVRVR